jgi:hypothetical protein
MQANTHNKLQLLGIIDNNLRYRKYSVYLNFDLFYRAFVKPVKESRKFSAHTVCQRNLYTPG